MHDLGGIFQHLDRRSGRHRQPMLLQDLSGVPEEPLLERLVLPALGHHSQVFRRRPLLWRQGHGPPPWSRLFHRDTYDGTIVAALRSPQGIPARLHSVPKLVPGPIRRRPICIVSWLLVRCAPATSTREGFHATGIIPSERARPALFARATRRAHGSDHAPELVGSYGHRRGARGRPRVG